jgi:YD repeat-containing protein
VTNPLAPSKHRTWACPRNRDPRHYTYTYDAAYRLLTDTHTGTQAGSTSTLTPTTFTYTYQPDGRLASFKNGSMAAQTITWDHDGNRLSYGAAKFTYNPDDTMATSQATVTSLIHTYSYDTYGRQTSDGCITYAYDGFDRTNTTTLIRPNTDASCPTGNGAATDKIVYNYDGLDRQTARTETTQATGQPAVVTASGFWYDGTSNTLAYQTYHSGATRAYTLTADGQPDAVTTAAGSTQYLLTDRTGSLVNTGTAAGGASGLACALRYDPFGTPISDNAAGTATG